MTTASVAATTRVTTATAARVPAATTIGMPAATARSAHMPTTTATVATA